jgi:ribosomal protein S18 acetylase RimI-like enzyme
MPESLDYNPDLSIFMMCEQCNTSAFVPMPAGFHVRPIKESELDFWKLMPLDGWDDVDKVAFHQTMTNYYDRLYAPFGDLFYRSCLMAVDEHDNPVGTCFTWKMHEKFTIMHWYKVLGKYEGRGIGRALLTMVMKRLSQQDYPVYLHTQVGSYRAVHLYSDFGFMILRDDDVGGRKNNLAEGLPILKRLMPANYYNSLRFGYARQEFLDSIATNGANDF